MTPEEERERTRTLLDKMGKHVAMAAFLLPEPTTPRDVINNGTISLLELPSGKYLVTNYHVWDGYLAKKLEVPGLRLVLMGEGYGRPVDVSTAELVDGDEGIDLAVLRFEANDVIESVGKSFYLPKRWPMEAPVEGDDVAFVGFPGNRRFPNDDYLSFESFLIAMKVTSVSDRKFWLRYENPEPFIQKFSSRPMDEFRWGGMSGSMGYRLDPDEMKFYVSGFLHAAGEGLSASFFAARSDLIQDDGTIRR
jgi:hypothetical protein